MRKLWLPGQHRKGVRSSAGQGCFSSHSRPQSVPVENTEVIKGGGITAVVDGHRVAVGNVALMEREKVALSDQAKADIARLEAGGSSLVLTAVDGELKILMGVRDQIRPGVKADLEKLKRLGVKNLVMLSGDNQGTVDAVSRELGLFRSPWQYAAGR